MLGEEDIECLLSDLSAYATQIGNMDGGSGSRDEESTVTLQSAGQVLLASVDDGKFPNLIAELARQGQQSCSWL